VARIALILVAVAALAASCAGGDEGGDDEGEDGELAGLTVFAAASLTEAFQELAPETTFSFAGSNELAAQIREGAPADVFASASPRYPGELQAEGLVDTPVAFATNRLVIVVPPDNPAGIESVDDLAVEGVKLVLGAEGVPAGDYARDILQQLGKAEVLDNVVSNEADVKGVLGKVVAGEADAGFVYATDAVAAGDGVETIELPAQPLVEYVVAPVIESPNFDAAQAFVELLLSDEGRKALEAAGFRVPEAAPPSG
jgi:molybdate transport system substrate-binding protein